MSNPNTNTQARICLLAITKHGTQQAAELAQQLPEAHICTSAKFAHVFADVANPVHAYSGALKDEMPTLFGNYDQIVCFVSLGAVVRLIAPHLKSKDEDPGIVVVDDAGQFVIPVLSGHVGGANDYAEKIAALINATPVVTTASDVGKTIPVDILGRHLGWVLEAPKINVTRVSAAVVNEERIAVVQEAGSRHWWTRNNALPKNIEVLHSFTQANLNHHAAVLWVTNAPVPETVWKQWHERLVVYRPPANQGSDYQP